MSAIDTAFLARCIDTLDAARRLLSEREPDDAMYDLLRAACVKEFELVLEQGGRLLRKRLRPYFASNREADRLTFKNIFRHAAKHGVIPAASCERWLAYRDHRNDTAHDCGERFAEGTLALLPGFVADARELERAIANAPDDD